MAYSERELLARIVQCEAGGEGDNGMRAVAMVVWWRTIHHIMKKNLQKAEKVKLSRILNISRQFLNDLELQKFSKHHSIYLYHIFWKKSRIFSKYHKRICNILKKSIIFYKPKGPLSYV